jgi:eukaryotic-like serine/threonine-protein kinase
VSVQRPWPEIETALDAILALPEREWSAACRRLSGADAAFRNELQSLLGCVGGFDPLLDRTPMLSGAADPVNAASLPQGARLGAYRILELIGRGGMGEVYRAERADGMFEQQVALKLMQPQVAQHAARFQAERQILARLEHPNIARLIDGGIMPDARPYMVMQLVAGRPLMQWCAEHPSDLNVRLQLFAEICAAVAYAHQNNVAHLDLKPANVLVSDSGEVKLLDFGVARSLSSDAQTQMRDAPLTPGYAAPEQLLRGTVSMASDVYALGLLLFELLCGELPWKATEAPHLLVAQVQRAERSELPAPSRFAATLPNPPVAARLLRADLDAVTLKALKSDPKERYATAAALCKDLQAYRSGHPVAAQPDSRGYRLRKFVGRHRHEVFGAAGLLVATFAVVVLLLANRFASQSFVGGSEAKPNFRSIAVLPFLDLSEHRNQEYFSDGLTEELIDLLARNSSLRVTARTSAFYFKGKPQDVITIARQLHVAHVLEGSVRKSGNTLRVTAHLIRADDGYDIWSQSYDRDLVDVFKVQDDIATAVVAALQAKLVARDSTERAPDGVRVEAFDQYLIARYMLDNHPENGGWGRAIAALQQAIQLDPSFATAYASLAYARCVDAANHRRGDVAEGSQALLDQALRLEPDLPTVYSARSMCRYYSLDFRGALDDANRAVAAAPGDVRYRNALAYALASNGRIAQAIVAATDATELDPLSVYSWEALGEFLTVERNWPAARRALDRALALNPESSDALFSSGVVDLLAGRADRAASAFARASSARMRLQGLALLEHAQGHRTQSQGSLAALIAQYSESSPFEIARVYAWQGNREEAFRWLERARSTKSPALANLMFDPFIAALSSDTRYQLLLRQLQLPN